MAVVGVYYWEGPRYRTGRVLTWGVLRGSRNVLRGCPGKKWTHEHFLNAVTAARLQIGAHVRKIPKVIGWSNVYWSRTINAVGEVLRVNKVGTTIT